MGLTRALLLFSSISTNMVSSFICVLMMSLSLSLYFSSYLKVPLLSPIFTASLQQIEFLMKFSVVKMPLFVVFFSSGEIINWQTIVLFLIKLFHGQNMPLFVSLTFLTLLKSFHQSYSTKVIPPKKLKNKKHSQMICPHTPLG